MTRVEIEIDADQPDKDGACEVQTTIRVVSERLTSNKGKNLRLELDIAKAIQADMEGLMKMIDHLMREDSENAK